MSFNGKTNNKTFVCFSGKKKWGKKIKKFSSSRNNQKPSLWKTKIYNERKFLTLICKIHKIKKLILIFKKK